MQASTAGWGKLLFFFSLAQDFSLAQTAVCAVSLTCVGRMSYNTGALTTAFLCFGATRILEKTQYNHTLLHTRDTHHNLANATTGDDPGKEGRAHRISNPV
eukprot:TRINITY_DN9509_c0_g1_i1.p7 TRINITY_DN9509_c0_g1~~TRINITY_DN9509_c0_g1_i1.p7  ORF type:complete len:101 (-),score=2.08 TRINITY_DN9509_c0_g1_i1:1353-1655(-)